MADKRMKVSLVLTAVDDMSRRIQQMTDRSTASLRRIEQRASAVAATTGRIGLVMAAGLGYGIKAAADMERLQVAMKTAFQGNEEAAASAFKQIQDFAAKTPFQMEEVMRAFIKLKNMGLDPSERALTAYGNTASAMAKNLNDMVEAVADAATGEFERLKEFGIKAKSEGDNVTFTFRGVSTTVRKEAQQIERYLMRIGLTDFAGGIENQSKTIYGQLSTLTDNFNMTAAALGKTLIPAINNLFAVVTPAIERVATWAQENEELATTIVGVATGLTLLTLGVSAAAFAVSGLSKAMIFVNTVMAFTATNVGFALFALRYYFVTSLVPALVAAKTAVLAFSAALWANPITWVVAAVVALAASVYLIYRNWEPISQFFTNLWDGVKQKFGVFVDYVRGLGTAFMEAGANIVDSLQNGIAAKWEAFTSWWGEKIQGIRDFLPFSPAKVGPLRDIHRIRLVETIAEGIQPQPVMRAMRRVAAAAAVSMPMVAGASPNAVAANSGGSVGTVLARPAPAAGVNINYAPVINLGSEVSAQSRAEIEAMLQRQKTELFRMFREQTERQNALRY